MSNSLRAAKTFENALWVWGFVGLRYGAIALIPERLRHFHVLKHSCGTHLASKGYNVEQIQDWLGHKNIQNTMIYLRVTNKRREEMADQLRDTWR